MQLELVFEDPFQNMRGLMQLQYLPLRGPGTYQFVMSVGGQKAWKKITMVPVVVQYIDNPVLAAPPVIQEKQGGAAKRRRAH
jgi:hypothetical protein